MRLGPAHVGNGVLIGSNSTPSRIGRGVGVKGGDRNDLFAIGNVMVPGTVSAAHVDGMSWMVVGGEADTPAIIDAISYTGFAPLGRLWGDRTTWPTRSRGRADDALAAPAHDLFAGRAAPGCLTHSGAISPAR